VDKPALPTDNVSKRENPMDVRELRYFIHVARVGSFNKAAARLNIAQPALSRQLKKLEDELGVQLLIRNGRGVELTEAGSVLLTQAEALIQQFEQTAKLVSGEDETFSGHIVVGLPPTCGLLIGPELFERFRARWPNATLLLREGISSSLEEWLLDRRLDLAIMHNPLPLEGIDIEPLLHERMVLVHAPGKPALPAEADIRIRDLADQPLILPALPHSNRRLVERAAAQHGARLNVVAEVDSVRFTKALVKRGFGCTIQTHAGVASDVENGELGARRIDRPPLMSTLCLGAPREAKSLWLVMETVRLLREVISDLVERGDWIGARLISHDAPLWSDADTDGPEPAHAAAGLES
jgi:LysR family nitrogen assimilation transcriptional regulator